MKLWPSQKKDIKRIIKEPSRGALVASVTGAGKTAVGIGLIQEVNPDITLILIPLNTEDGWRKTLLEQTGQTLRMMGNDTPRQVHNTDLMTAGEPGVYAVGWEWMTNFANYDKWRPDMLIADEIHRACNRSTQTANMLHDLGLRVWKTKGYRLGLSATPNGNRMEGFWAVAHALWPGPEHHEEFNAYGRWSQRHLEFQSVIIGKDENGELKRVAVAGVELVPGSVVKELPLYIRHEAETRCCKFHPKGIQADLPKRVIHRVGVDLSVAQRKVYDELEEFNLAWLEEHDLPVTAELPLVMTTRLHQICLAVPSTELATRMVKDKETGESAEKEYIKVSYPMNVRSSKIDALMDVLTDIPDGERVLVFTHSRGIIDPMIGRIRKRKGIGRVEGWHGGIKGKDREQLKQDFRTGDIRVLVCQVASVSEGTDGLQDDCWNEVWISPSSSGVINQQALGRLRRHGQKRMINSWWIVARDTREESQLEKLETNRDYLAGALRAR